MGKGFLAAACAALLFAACGDDDDTTGAEGGAGEDAKAVDVASMDNAKGDVNFCMGKDTSGNMIAATKSFNEEQSDVKVELIEFSTSADEQRAQFVQRQEAKSGECDVFWSDVIWTAEFVSQDWIYDMTPYMETRKEELIPATLSSVDYDGKLWGMPQQTNAAFLFYRTDQVDQPPDTWQEVYEEGGAKDGVVYQGAPYEGLTVDFLELAFAAGGEVISEDGKTAVIDSPENEAALQLMVDGIEDGTAATGASRPTWRRRRGATSRAARQPSCATGRTPTRSARPRAPRSRASSTSPRCRRSRAEAAPASSAATTWSSRSSPRTRGGALKWIDYVTSEDQQLLTLRDYSQAAVVSSVYDDPEVKKKYPFAPQLREAVSQAKSRPVSPVYPQSSQAISTRTSAPP